MRRERPAGILRTAQGRNVVSHLLDIAGIDPAVATCVIRGTISPLKFIEPRIYLVTGKEVANYL